MKKILLAALITLSALLVNAEQAPVEFKTIKIIAIKDGKVSVNELMLFNGEEAIKLVHRKNGRVIEKGRTYCKTRAHKAFDGDETTQWRTAIITGDRYMGFKMTKNAAATKVKIVTIKNMYKLLKLELLDADGKIILSIPVPQGGEIILSESLAAQKNIKTASNKETK